MKLKKVLGDPEVILNICCTPESNVGTGSHV